MSLRPVQIHDSLSGGLRPLEPGPDGEVGIYACGPTTYGPIHVGNARPYAIFMLLRRFLAREGYRPRLVVNLTDINDKIYDAAKREGIPSAEWAEQMVEAYTRDTGALGLGRPDDEPKATETIPEIVALISDLIDREHAYESGGDVYFAVRSFPDYGKLSNRRPGDMDQGEEAGSAALKRDPLDFALWKATKEGEDSSWPSPWGAGRPGWHIECSAMAEKLLGVEFAIHGGGSDLVFPHHENEIAQTEAARARPLAKIWMHNGMIRIADEKMSKSVGNIFQLSEAIERFTGETVVAYLASGHYRQPLEFSEDALREAGARVERIRNFLRVAADEDREPDPEVHSRREAFLAALAADFNTARAFAELFELIAEGNRRPLAGARAAVIEMASLLGLDELEDEVGGEAAAAAEVLLAERERARAERDWARADEIRDRLAELGYDVRDTPEGARLTPRARG